MAQLQKGKGSRKDFWGGPCALRSREGCEWAPQTAEDLLHSSRPSSASSLLPRGRHSSHTHQ